MALDEDGSRLDPRLQVKRAEQRLDHVAQHVVAVLRAVVQRLPAEPRLRRQADRAADCAQVSRDTSTFSRCDSLPSGSCAKSL
jgi:hypothetical protein